MKVFPWTAEISTSTISSLCGYPVAVDLVSNKTFCGNVFTFDPVDFSVAIIVFVNGGMFITLLFTDKISSLKYGVDGQWLIH